MHPGGASRIVIPKPLAARYVMTYTMACLCLCVHVLRPLPLFHSLSCLVSGLHKTPKQHDIARVQYCSTSRRVLQYWTRRHLCLPHTLQTYRVRQKKKRGGDLDVVGDGALLELGLGLDHVFDTAA